ncbi:MAG: ABC transporter ATP-binding protein [Acidimicrobiales bacterium]
MAEITIRGVTKRYDGGVSAVENVDLDVADGELLVLVGPSGCGKSTLLRTIAGLEEVTAGEIRIGGRDVTRLPPKARDIAMIFQSYALYPHMSVRRNIGYPLRLAKVPASELDRRVEAVARVLQLEELLDRRPGQLSGGQRQRVAMGRAIVRQPRAFLMDEPLSNLDAKLRVEMRAEIARLQRELAITTVYVTHDQVEAMTMGTRVAVLRSGRLQQIDTPQRLYDAPANLFVATFMGSPAMNVFDSRIETDGDQVAIAWAGDHRLVGDEAALSSFTALATHAGRSVVLGLRPEAFIDASLEPGVPGDRVVDATVDLVESLGAELLVHVSVAGVEAVARLAPRSRARPGDTIKLAVDTAQLHLFDPATGASLR